MAGEEDDDDCTDDELDPDSHDTDNGNFIQVRYKKGERKVSKKAQDRTQGEGVVC